MAPRQRSDHVGLLGIGAAALAVACCAGLPVLAGTAASIGVAAAIGIGVGGVVAVGAAALLIGVMRARRRSCEPNGRDREGLTR
jgi:hypothetical protein